MTFLARPFILSLLLSHLRHYPHHINRTTYLASNNRHPFSISFLAFTFHFSPQQVEILLSPSCSPARKAKQLHGHKLILPNVSHQRCYNPTIVLP